MKSLNNLIEDALKNIQSDRQKTKNLLEELTQYLVGSYDRFTDSGAIAAKYLETLQRSNEQLVKLAALVQKKEAQTGETELSDTDKDELFDLINFKGRK
jgi:hypothetical protein